MTYLALGDSISIDDYTGVPKGGAASQFATLIRADTFQNLTANGFTTADVLRSLSSVKVEPNVVTLTAGGNNFIGLLGPICTGIERLWKPQVENIADGTALILDWLGRFRCPVILNTVYDPTDGDEANGREMGLGDSARQAFILLNDFIRSLGTRPGIILSDLEKLFAGHGFWSPNPWIVAQIEPNHAGATAIANHWLELYSKRSSTVGRL